MNEKPSNENETSEVEESRITAKEVNSAISDRLKRHEAKILSSLTDKLAESLNPVLERLAKFDIGEAPKKTVDSAQADISKELEKLKMDYQKRIQAVEDERKKEKQMQLQTEERNALTEALLNAGVTDAVQRRAATAMLYSEERRISRDATGEIMFKGTDKLGDGEFSLEDGVKAWVQGEGKAFLPARAVGGSGSAPVRSQSKASSKPSSDRDERVKQNLAILMGVKNAV